MIPEDEYPKLLKACRITGTLLVLAHGWTALAAAYGIGKYGPVFESMVEGGTAALPSVVRSLIRFQLPVGAALALLMLGGCWVLWRSPQLSRVVLVMGVSVSALGFAAMVIDRVMQYPIQQIMSEFSE